MKTYQSFQTWILIVVMLSACGTTPTSSVAIPVTGNNSIGTVNTMQTNVEVGPLGNLIAVPISHALFSEDAIRVTNGGVALLNFFDQIALKLFNDTSVGGVKAEILENTDRRIHMKLERGGLSGQVAKNSGGADFEIANGVHIYILGTQFYITYDPQTNIVSAGNFDGTVGYQVPGQSPQLLPVGKLIDILPDGMVQVFDLTFSVKDFDRAAQVDESPIEGLRDLREQPAPTLTPTMTGTLTFIPTTCSIPIGWIPINVQPDDTLYTITSRHSTTVETLEQGNCLDILDLIPGMTLYVPPTSTVTPCFHPAGWVTYIVQSGDTLSILGQKYRVAVATLQNGNCMGFSTRIYTGQILYVPNVATSTPVSSLMPILTPTMTMSLTPTPTDTPAEFNNGEIGFDGCYVNFYVEVFDFDDIDTVMAFYGINSSTNMTSVSMVIDGAYYGSTTLTPPTTYYDTIYYYFQATDTYGRITRSNVESTGAPDCYANSEGTPAQEEGNQ